MKLETILQVLYTNDMMEVVSLALQIDNNLITNDKSVGDNIRVEMSKETAAKMGVQRKADNDRNGHWIVMLLPIVAVNKYKLKRKYCVEVAGELKWVDESDASLTDIEYIPLETPGNIA